MLGDVLHDLKAVNLTHHDIGNDKIAGLLLKVRQPLLAVCGSRDRVALAC